MRTDKIKRVMMPGASEHDEQAALIEWCRLNEGKYPQLKWIMAIPNGTYTTRTAALRAVSEGVKKGVSDLFLPAPAMQQDHTGYNIYYSGLWIEMKTATGKVSKEQQEFIRDMRAVGYAAAVCRGFEEARQVIEDYLEGEY